MISFTIAFTTNDISYDENSNKLIEEFLVEPVIPVKFTLDGT